MSSSKEYCSDFKRGILLSRFACSVWFFSLSFLYLLFLDFRKLRSVSPSFRSRQCYDLVSLMTFFFQSHLHVYSPPLLPPDRKSFSTSTLLFRSTTCKWVVSSFDSTIRDFFLIIFSLLGFKVSMEANANPIANQNTQTNSSNEKPQYAGAKIEEIPIPTSGKKSEGGVGNENRRRNVKSQNDHDLD